MKLSERLIQTYGVSGTLLGEIEQLEADAELGKLVKSMPRPLVASPLEGLLQFLEPTNDNP